MFGRTPKIVNTKLDEIIDRIMEEMDNCGPYSPEYPKLIGHLQRMITLRKSEDKHRTSPDTIANILGNLLIAVIIVSWEQNHIVNSKAFGFINLKTK